MDAPLRTLTHATTALLTLLVLGCQQRGDADIARGNLLAKQGKLSDAAEAYGRAAANAPGNARPPELLGHVLVRAGKLPEAKVAYERALSLSPESSDATLGLARIAQEGGDFDRAVALLDALVGRAPDALAPRLARIQVLLERRREGDVARALEDSAKAVAILPTNPDVQFSRGVALLSSGDKASAAAQFQALAEASPDSPLAPYGFARVAGADGDKVGVMVNLSASLKKAEAAKVALPLLRMRADPAFAFLKDDADFQRLLWAAPSP